MNVEDLRNYCLSKKHVTEEFPFDDVTLVFKVAGKMFALIGLDHVDLSIALKCDPERAQVLRSTHSAIGPAYHMSKTHWNGVRIDGTLKPEFVHELIDHSYELVVSKLSGKLKKELDL
ncbi:MAG: MmcQ/YjbR family DNA-binding protein [Salinivirgaceae bacterium]|jgi:predicted DNA-binding protein (MmcQ/YjbR family)|nr:MmcQ/YjbR family DNA-binding protein [Salinivirgaceae bacterium]